MEMPDYLGGKRRTQRGGEFLLSRIDVCLPAFSSVEISNP
jgi:hypothetical protein